MRFDEKCMDESTDEKKVGCIRVDYPAATELLEYIFLVDFVEQVVYSSYFRSPRQCPTLDYIQNL